MGKFQVGNRLAAKEKWNLFEIHGFQKRLHGRRIELNYSNEDLAHALDYSVQYVRMLQGDWKYNRQPSQEVLRRWQAFESTDPKAKPSFLPMLIHDPGRDCVPLSQVLGPYKQCPECVIEFKRGVIAEERFTWWAMKSHRQKYCKPIHRNAARSRRESRRKRHAKRRGNEAQPSARKK